VITVSDTARAVIDDGTFTYDVRVSSWLGDTLLADDIPISDATEESDRSLNVPERVRFTIPKRDRNVSWVPTAYDSPLAANGQTLKVSLGVGKVRGADGVEWFQRGEFLILGSEEGDETIEVTAAGLLYLVQEAGFIAPFQPSGTFAGTLRALIEPAVQADLDSAPNDRAIPSAITWDDRIGALYELLDAWSAVPHMNEQGYLEVLPDVTPTVAVRSFTNQTGGTVVSSVGASTREGGFNVVVATGNAADGSEVRGQAYVSSGPWAYPGGVANPLPVPFGYASPLLTTQSQCTSAAQTVLSRKMRQAVLRRFMVTAVPDPTLQLGDAVDLTDDEVTGLLCTVERIILPYKPGAMQLTVVSTE
jgi:hypothetical protein